MIIKSDMGNNRGTDAPRSIVRLDGQETFFNSWEVTLNSTNVADEFTLEMPFLTTIHAPQTYLISSADYPSLLFTKSQILVEVFVGYPPNPDKYQASDLTRIMYGYMDEAETQFDESGEVVTATGRNQVAPFVDNKSTQKYQNMTSSAIAQLLASNHGLKAKVTQTYTLSGTYYNGDHVNLDSDITEWDLLNFLAEQEGFALRVFDNTLYFGPFDSLFAVNTNKPIPYTWGQNIKRLNMQRYPHAAKNIAIEVHSYDKKKKKHIKAIANKKIANASQTFNQRYYRAGLSQDQAQKMAQAKLDELSRLELVGEMTVSGNPKLTLDTQIVLYGVGMNLSQDYYIRQAKHTFQNRDNANYECDVNFSNLLLQDEGTGGI